MRRTPPTLDMNVDGSFRTQSSATVPLSFKLLIGGITLALLAGAAAFAALALWVFSMVLPVLVGAGVFAWVMMRYRRWRTVRSAVGSRALF